MKEYVYRKLENVRTIRVLTVHGGAFDAPIRCTIRHHELGVQPSTAFASAARPLPPSRAEPRYEALSWTWGEDKPLGRPSLHVTDAGQPANSAQALAVNPNLYKAVQYLRERSRDRYLWIDAVCINQWNSPEKDVQVAMMADIYRTAQNVCVWLGEPEIGSKAALDFVSRNVADLGQYERIMSDPTFADAWSALGRLMLRPWFSRLWVVQEISLARGATVHCGSECVTWYDFEYAVALFERDAARISRLLKASKGPNHDTNGLAYVATWHATRLIHVRADLFRRRDDTQAINEYKLSLNELVPYLTSFQAKEPHDTVYAVLALANDTGTNKTAGSANKRITRVFDVNYSQPFVEVCKQFITYSISRAESYNLDILCRRWAPARAQDLPSWVTVAANAESGREREFSHCSGVQDFSLDADQLVAGRHRYNACPSQQAVHTAPRPDAANDWYFGETSDTAMSLFVTGFILDEVKQTSSPCQAGVIPAEWLKFARWDPWTRTQSTRKVVEPPETLWRTLVGDRCDEGRNIPAYYPRALMHAVQIGAEGAPIDTQRLARDRAPGFGDFMSRVKRMVWNRRLLVSKRDGHLGLAPYDAQPGDCEYSRHHAHGTRVITDSLPRYLYPQRLQCPGHVAQDRAKVRPASFHSGWGVLCRCHDGWRSYCRASAALSEKPDF